MRRFGEYMERQSWSARFAGSPGECVVCVGVGVEVLLGVGPVCKGVAER
jgi:hypothetical protein